MAQPGGRQHVIPASHIGNFSNSVLPSRRDSIVWYRRDSMPKTIALKAENVGIHKHIYTIQTDNIDDRYVDTTWDYVEHNLNTVVEALEDHTKSPFFQAEIWATILVPFVAQLFVRGVEYSKNLLTRASFLEMIFPNDDKSVMNDNTNLNRLIDFQINCGLLCAAEWKLLHNESNIPLILNDLGYVTFNGKKYGGGMGYLIPLSKKLILMIFKNTNPSYGVRFSGYSGSYKIWLPQSTYKADKQTYFFNSLLALGAQSEIYGATEEVVNQAWEKRAISKLIPPIGPTHLQQPQFRDGDLVEHFEGFLDKIEVSYDKKKGAMGGKRIYVIEETWGQGPYALGYEDLP